MDRRRRNGYFATWQEAQMVCQTAGLTRCVDYKELYAQIDKRLPSNPNLIYADWPGWPIFLGRKKYQNFYATWQEASAACRKAGIGNSVTYEHCYKEIDNKLPSNPAAIYDDWPGWDEFLGRNGKNYYSTWRRASKVCRKLKITTVQDYLSEGIASDAALHDRPEIYYSDWPGWETFLGKPQKNKYLPLDLAAGLCREFGVCTRAEYKFLHKRIHQQLPGSPDQYYGDEWPGWKKFLFGAKSAVYASWQAAAVVCRDQGINTQAKYFRDYRRLDIRLPCHPEAHYPDWPGWDIFFGRPKKTFCPSWQEAGAVAVKLGINSYQQYLVLYRQAEGSLPSNPKEHYADWPGWAIFLGRPKVELYPSWQEASEVCIRAGLNSQYDYFDFYKKLDQRLPGNPVAYYDDWPGWDLFFGRVRRQFYATWQEASAACVRLGIRNQVQYMDRYRQLDDLLPSNPSIRYASDWPGWHAFFGKVKKEFYPTLIEAQAAVAKLRIKNFSDYQHRYKEDPLLPCNPIKFYNGEWLGWKTYLGHK